MTTSLKLRLVFSLLGCAAALPFVHADQPNPLRVLVEAKGPAEAKAERGFVFRHGPGKGELETVAFLGVETAGMPPALTAQLGLPKHSGLVVRHVVPESPAAVVLQVHDVLLKLDDQLLIEPRQFSVLVRNHQEGDEVTLTFVRAGKQSTAKVKLGKQQAPKLSASEAPGVGGEPFDHLVGDDRVLGPGRRVEMERVLSLLEHPPVMAGTAAVRMPHPAPSAPGFRSLAVSPANSSMVFSDDEGSLELTLKDGKKSLVAKDAKGAQIFAGPVDTAEQRAALSPEVRARLDRLEGMQGFSFEADETFHGDVKTFHVAPRRIEFSRPATPAWTEERPSPAI